MVLTGVPGKATVAHASGALIGIDTLSATKMRAIYRMVSILKQGVVSFKQAKS